MGGWRNRLTSHFVLFDHAPASPERRFNSSSSSFAAQPNWDHETAGNNIEPIMPKQALARQIEAKPGAPRRSNNSRRSRSAIGNSSRASRARCAIGAIHASAASASVTGRSPGARAASAPAAASSHDAGNVTCRGGESGSTPAITRLVRTPCHVRLVRITAMLGRPARLAKGILRSSRFTTTKYGG